ncbi:hypothetical protein [Helicobacter sp. T3_23-1056]
MILLYVAYLLDFARFCDIFKNAKPSKQNLANLLTLSSKVRFSKFRFAKNAPAKNPFSKNAFAKI